jgi:hypothetical protein
MMGFTGITTLQINCYMNSLLMFMGVQPDSQNAKLENNIEHF